MPNTALAFIGGLAAVINTLGLIPYIRDIFKNKTKPERAMWWIYAVLFTVLFAAQLKTSAGWLLLVTGAYIFSAVFIAILSIKYGYGSFHKRDFISIAVAVLGLCLWILTDNPLLAILMIIVVDAAAFWLTLLKTWKAPHTETLVAWQAAFVSAILSLFTVRYWELSVFIYPLYAVAGTALIVCVIMYRRTKVKEDLVDF